MRYMTTSLVLLAVLISGSCQFQSRSSASYTLMRYFGHTGDEPGEFARPAGIAVGDGGELYIADSGNQRVQVLSSEGTFLRQWGGRGTEPGQFENPVDVAVGPDGSVYVADFDLDRIQKFTPAGSFVLAWGQSGSLDGEFDGGSGLTVGPDGKVYVADFYNHRIHVFSQDGELVATIGQEGHGAGDLYYPTDAAMNARGELLAADAYNHRIHAFSDKGVTAFRWGTRWMTAIGIGRFRVPSGVAIDRNGRVHVADSGNKRALLLDSDGRVLAEWKLTEDEHPESYSPVRAATDGSRAYFVDTSNDRIAVLEVNP